VGRPQAQPNEPDHPQLARLYVGRQRHGGSTQGAEMIARAHAAEPHERQHPGLARLGAVPAGPVRRRRPDPGGSRRQGAGQRRDQRPSRRRLLAGGTPARGRMAVEPGPDAQARRPEREPRSSRSWSGACRTPTVPLSRRRPALRHGEPVRGLAPAKVNLFLHVGPVAADGYHPLASLVAFADVGDSVTVEPADRLSLIHRRPLRFGPERRRRQPDPQGPARARSDHRPPMTPPVAVTLDKQLPIAAGLGGGSSDAGAALKAVARPARAVAGRRRRWRKSPPRSAPTAPCACMPAPPGPRTAATG
jgi:hypothetical protein